MAAPVVAGCAALLRAYFPDLTAEQIKQILMKSVTKVPGKMIMPVDDEKAEEAEDNNKKLKEGKISYKKLCKSARTRASLYGVSV